MKPKPYIGINNDPNGAMNPTGNVIRDAWVFSLIPEDETCEGWSMGQMDNLYDQVVQAWQPYANLPSNLPDDLKQRHAKIYIEAMQQARAKGWDPDKDVADEIADEE